MQACTTASIPYLDQFVPATSNCKCKRRVCNGWRILRRLNMHDEYVKGPVAKITDLEGDQFFQGRDSMRRTDMGDFYTVFVPSELGFHFTGRNFDNFGCLEWHIN